MGVLFSCSFPFGPPFRSQKYKEVPPLPILRRSPTEAKGAGRGPGRRPRFSADPSPARCFRPLGSPVGISGWTLGGSRQGGLIKPGCLICHPYFPPIRPTDVPLRLPRVAPGKPRGPWNVPTTAVRVFPVDVWGSFGCPGGGPWGGTRGALLGMSSGLLPRLENGFLQKTGPQAIAPPQGLGWRYQTAPGTSIVGRFWGCDWGLFRVENLVFRKAGPQAIAPPQNQGGAIKLHLVQASEGAGDELGAFTGRFWGRHWTPRPPVCV